MGARGEESASPFSLGGLAFGDLYHLPSHHLPEGDGATGAVLRRAYLTGNAKFDTGWFGRLRIEINQSGEFETYDFEADFKDAYVGYRFENHTLTAGLQPTLTFDVVESVWDLRYLMRTPADLQGAPSRDTGVTLKGRIDDAWSYRLLYGAGADFGAESGDGGMLQAALNWKLSENWLLDLYVDHEKRPGPSDITSGQLFAGYESERTAFGAQYLYRDRDEEASAKLASIFLARRFSQKFRGIGRIDRIFSPSLKGDNISYVPFDPNAPATMYLAGLEYQISEHFYFTPNTIVISYDRNEGVRPETDFFLRLTFFVNFE